MKIRTTWFYLKYLVVSYYIPTNFKEPGGELEKKQLEAENETEAVEEATRLYLEILRDAKLSKKLSKKRSNVRYFMPENPCVSDCPLSGCEGKCTAKVMVKLDIPQKNSRHRKPQNQD